MANPICPTDCTSVLNSVNFSDCAPDIVASEIHKVFIAKGNCDPFADWTSATEWTQRIMSSGSYVTAATAVNPGNDSAIRPLTVIGDKPAASSVVKDISNGRKHVVGKDHTLNITVDDVSEENYEFMRATECGGTFRIWYETKGGFLYGGNSGIRASIVMDDVLNRGNDEIEAINGVITWRERFSPERCSSPIFQL